MIENYGDVGALSILVGLMVWYLKHTTRQQSEREKKNDEIQQEDRKFSRGLITNTLKDIHNTGLKNAELNRKSISMQKNFQKESVGTLKTICDRLNGGTEGMKAIKALKVIDQRKKSKKIKVERRK